MASDAPLRIDARGMRCPWPALRAARAMREVSAFIILADDPKAAGELAALAEARGWSFSAPTAPEPTYLLARESGAASSL